MTDTTAPHGPFLPWEPPELGMPRATAISLALVVLIAAFCYWASVILAPRPRPPIIQVTQAQLTQLPAPPPPPNVVPPPKPVPAVIPKPPPAPSRIVVATKPPPPVPHVTKPIRRIVPRHERTAPATPAAPAQPAAPPAPAARTAPATSGPPSNGIPIYGEKMHAVLEANQNVPPALAQLGVSGTALIKITVAPDGHVLSAQLVRSSGVALIDQTALAHVREASFGAFNAEMPTTPQTFMIPVDIQPQPDSDAQSGE